MFRMSRAVVGQKRRKTRKKVLGIHPALSQLVWVLPVRILAAVRYSHARFDFRPTCTFIMGRSHSSVLIQPATRHSVRSKTSRSIWGFTKISGPIRVPRAAVRASGRRETCVITSAATLETSKYFHSKQVWTAFEAKSDFEKPNLSTSCGFDTIKESKDMFLSVNPIYKNAHKNFLTVDLSNAPSAALATTAKMCSKLTWSSVSFQPSLRSGIWTTKDRNRLMSKKVTVKTPSFKTVASIMVIMRSKTWLRFNLSSPWALRRSWASDFSQFQRRQASSKGPIQSWRGYLDQSMT